VEGINGNLLSLMSLASWDGKKGMRTVVSVLHCLSASSPGTKR